MILRTMTQKLVAGLLLGTSLASCSLAPQYQRPQTPAVAAYKEIDGWKTAEPADATPRGNWWEAFGDPTLNALEEKAGSGNEDLKVALARYQEARASARVARAAFLPQITASGHDYRERSSPNFTPLRSGKPFNDYLADADLTYEIDLWGRVRNGAEAAKDTAKAADADRLSVDLSLRAELAANYFTLRGYDAQQKVLDDAASAFEKALTITRDRFKGGIAAEADVDQAETQYHTTRTQAADMRLKRAQLEHAIAVLTGQPPSGFALPAAPLAARPLNIAPSLPSKLLERRPDIAAAERRVMAANAEIGVARAAWFPTFSIDGLLGLQSAASGNWMTAASRIWSLGPSVAAPLFDAGRINALSDQARAAYDENAALYRKTVLTAYREVEDTLAAHRELAHEHDSESLAVAAAERALKQAQDRYTGGIVTYLDVIVAQNSALQARLAFIDIDIRRVVANVQLVRALGGGLDVVPANPPAIGVPDFIGPRFPAMGQSQADIVKNTVQNPS